MNTEIVKMIQWFAEVAEREYPQVPGTLTMLDLQRLKRDRDSISSTLLIENRQIPNRGRLRTTIFVASR